MSQGWLKHVARPHNTIMYQGLIGTANVLHKHKKGLGQRCFNREDLCLFLSCFFFLFFLVQTERLGGVGVSQVEAGDEWGKQGWCARADESY
jgi:hypothetical protein